MGSTFGSFLSQLLDHPLGRTYLQVFGWPFISTRVRANRILSLLDAKKDEKILDAGCGFGLYSLALANNGVNVVGVDIDEKQLSTAKEWAGKLSLPNAQFEAVNICKLPYKDESFDKVLCVDVIEHILDDNLAISQLARVLKVNGTLALTTPTPTMSQTHFFHRDTPEADGHVREGYTYKDISGVLGNNGLSITEHHYYNRFFERFASEMNSFFLGRAGGLEELKEASVTGSMSNVRNLSPVLLTFPPLFVLSKLDSIIAPTVRKNCIAVKAKKQRPLRKR